MVYPFLLLAVVGEKTLPKGSVISLWRHELDATDRVAPCVTSDGETGQPSIGLWTVMQITRKHVPLTAAQCGEFLDLTKKVMQARVKVILEKQDRGAYERAARMLMGWIEAARFAGRHDEATALLERIGKDYSRRPAFCREIALLQKAEGKTQNAE